MSLIAASQFDAAAIIEDDTILPSQFYGASQPLSPELKLVLEVFESAVRNYQVFREVNTARGRRYFKEAKEYLFDDCDYFYSAVWCCEYLNFDIDAIRKRLASGNVTTLRRRGSVVSNTRLRAAKERH